MRRLAVIAALLLLPALPALALAQEAKVPPELAAIVDFSNLQTALGNLVSAYQTIVMENAALKKSATDLAAYLKACGDAPGCTQPVEKK